MKEMYLVEIQFFKEAARVSDKLSSFESQFCEGLIMKYSTKEHKQLRP